MVETLPLAQGFFQSALNGIEWLKLLAVGAIVLVGLWMILREAAPQTRTLPRILGAILLAALLYFAATNITTLSQKAEETVQELEQSPPVRVGG